MDYEPLPAGRTDWKMPLQQAGQFGMLLLRRGGGQESGGVK